jgi:hypothetical protein
MNVIFSKNRDGKTANMFIDGDLKTISIPYIPSRGIDHRAVALYYQAAPEGKKISDIVFDVETENIDYIRQAFQYMSYPKEVSVSIYRRLHNSYDGWPTMEF